MFTSTSEPLWSVNRCHVAIMNLLFGDTSARTFVEPFAGYDRGNRPSFGKRPRIKVSDVAGVAQWLAAVSNLEVPGLVACLRKPAPLLPNKVGGHDCRSTLLSSAVVCPQTTY